MADTHTFLRTIYVDAYKQDSGLISHYTMIITHLSTTKNDQKRYIFLSPRL